jgi:hypothetical protein
MADGILRLHLHGCSRAGCASLAKDRFKQPSIVISQTFVQGSFLLVSESLTAASICRTTDAALRMMALCSSAGAHMQHPVHHAYRPVTDILARKAFRSGVHTGMLQHSCVRCHVFLRCTPSLRNWQHKKKSVWSDLSMRSSQVVRLRAGCIIAEEQSKFEHQRKMACGSSSVHL